MALNLVNDEVIEVLLINGNWQRGIVFDANIESTLSLLTEKYDWVIPYENVMAIRRPL